MLLLAQSGERVAALEQYETCARLLQEEMGVEPSAETADLYRRIKAGELQLAIASAVASSTDTLVNPYKGLRAFQETDVGDFFGRETLTQRLLDRLAEDVPFTRFLAVVGPSGCGKSSVVKAGLIPSVREGKLPGSADWPVVEIVPGNHPFEELEIALTRLATDLPTDLMSQLKRDKRGLVRAARMALPEGSDELLLVIDQFEEVFTLTADQRETKFLLDSLYVAATDPRTPLRVVITLRGDFYDRPLMYPDFSEMVRQRTEAVVPMTTDELERAVTGPADRVGISLETGLATTIVTEVSEQPGALPMLQYALTELFDHRENGTMTLATYQAMGGTLGALARRADAVYTGLPTNEQALAQQVFLRLVTLGEGTEDIRRRTLRSELASVGGEATQMVLDAFDRARLLTFDQDFSTGEPSVELAHEAIIREWGQLREWLDEGRNDIRLQRLLARASEEWQRANRDSSYLLHGSRLAQFEEWASYTNVTLTVEEQGFLNKSISEERQRLTQRRRFRNIFLTVAISLAIVMTGLALFAFDSRTTAISARATSDYNAQAAAANAAEVQELALVNGARAAMGNQDLELAVALAVAANRFPASSGQAQLVLSEAAYAPGLVRYLAQAEAHRLELSPDGRTVLNGGFGSLQLWDWVTGDIIHDLQGHGSLVHDAIFSPAGRLALSSDIDQVILMWDLETGEAIKRFEFPSGVNSPVWTLAYHPDGQHVLGSVTTRDDGVKMVEWDAATGTITRQFSGVEFFGALDLDITSDGRRAMTTGWDGTWVLWDLETGDPIHVFADAHKDWTSGCFTPDGQRALTGAQNVDGTLALWDVETFELIWRYEAEDESFFMTTCNVDGRTALTSDGVIHLWDLERLEEIPLSGNGGLFTGMLAEAVLSLDGNTLIHYTPNGIGILDLQHGAEVSRFPLELDAVFAELPPEVAGINPFEVDFSPDGRLMFLGTAIWHQDDPTYRPGPNLLYDLSTGQRIQQLGEVDIQAPYISGASGAAFSPDGSTIAMPYRTGQLFLGQVENGLMSQPFVGHRSVVLDAAFSPDGRTLLSCGADGLIFLWDVATGQEIRRFVGHHGAVHAIAFSPDSRTALSGAEDGQVNLWDVETGGLNANFNGHEGAIMHVAFNPGGQTALSTGWDGLVILWDLTTGQEIRRYIGHDQFSNFATFLPDGETFLSTGPEGAYLWHLTSGERIRFYPGDFDGISLNPDGHSFYTFDRDNHVVREFRLDTADELMAWTLANRYVRELNCSERDLYQIEPPCNEEGIHPTRTPYATALPSSIATLTPDTDSAQETTIPNPTITPTIIPRHLELAHLGVNRGEVATGESQIWIYEGIEGDMLVVRVMADNPANWATRSEEEGTPENGVLDTFLSITAPDGSVLTISPANGSTEPFSDDIEAGTNTDSMFELTLPDNGLYRIEVSGAGLQTGGSYSLIIESESLSTEISD